MVKDVAGIRAKLELHILPDRERLAEGEVDVAESWTVQAVPPGIAKRSRCWLGEGCFVEPLLCSVESALAGEVRVPDYVGIPLAIGGQRVRGRVIGHRHGIRLAAQEHQGARGLPSADQQIDQSVVVQEVASLAKWKLIDG